MSDPSVIARIGVGLTKARNFTMNFVFVVVVVLLLVVLFSSGEIDVPSGSALVLNPKGILVDQQTVVDPLQDLLSPQSTLPEAAVLPMETTTGFPTNCVSSSSWRISSEGSGLSLRNRNTESCRSQ